MKTAIGAAMLATTLPAHTIEAPCETDRVFEDQGWFIHKPDEFNAALQRVLERIREGTDLGPVSTAPVYNEELGKFIERITIDQVSTPTEIMIDDLVLYADEDSQAVYEVRWFDGELKHIAYTSLMCANPPLPWAQNSMG